MKVVLTTVSKASVSIDQTIFSSIEKGILLLVGFKNGDNEAICEQMSKKILGLRIFSDIQGKTNLSLADVDGEIMCVSQFTLYADVKKGRRPSFVEALEPVEAKRLYLYFVDKLIELSSREVKTGIFGEDMLVSSINDGPFTLVISEKDL